MKFGMKKLWSWCLILAMAINLIPAQAIEIGTPGSRTAYSDSDDPMQSSTDGQWGLGSASILMENVEKRTEFSKEFKLSNGFNMVVVYPEAVHYEKDGKWEDIDNTLYRVESDAETVYQTTAGAWHAEFPQQIRTGTQIKISKNEYDVGIALTGQLRSSASGTETYGAQGLPGNGQASVITPEQNTQGQIQELGYSQQIDGAQYPETILENIASRLSYIGVYQNTDIVYDISSTQLFESVVINAYDTAMVGYQYLLNAGGLLPVVNEDGSIILQDQETGDNVMTMSAPSMVDNNGITSSDVTVAMEETDNGYLLTYYLPTQWLATDNRAWPVVMSQGINISSNAQNIMDCTVASSYAGLLLRDKLGVGYAQISGKMRTYLKYMDLPILDSSDLIVSATLSLYSSGGASGTAVIEAHAVNESWTDEDLSWSNQPEFDPTVEDYSNVDNLDRYYWDITDIARGWYTESNTGVMLRVSEEKENGNEAYWKSFYPMEPTIFSFGQIPQITIIYRNVNGVENYWDYTSVSAARAGSGYVNNYTGNITWVRNDLGFSGNRMPVSISHIYNTGNSALNTYGLGKGWQTNYHQTIHRYPFPMVATGSRARLPIRMTEIFSSAPQMHLQK